LDGEEATNLYQDDLASTYVPGDVGIGTYDNSQPVSFDNLNAPLVTYVEDDFEYPTPVVVALPEPPYSLASPGDWVNQNTEAYDADGFSAQAAATQGDKSFSRNINLSGAAFDTELNFKWRVDSGGDKSLTLEVYNITDDVMAFTKVFDDTNYTLGENWYKTADDTTYDGTLVKDKEYTITWRYSNADWQAGDTKTAWVDELFIGDPTLPVEEFNPIYVEEPLVGYVPQLENNWVNQNAVAHDAGGFAAQAAKVYGGGISTMQKDLNLRDFSSTDSIDVSFWWKNSAGSKNLTFEVVKVGVGVMSENTRTLAAGSDAEVDNVQFDGGAEYTLKWTYENLGTDTEDPQKPCPRN